MELHSAQRFVSCVYPYNLRHRAHGIWSLAESLFSHDSDPRRPTWKCIQAQAVPLSLGRKRLRWFWTHCQWEDLRVWGVNTRKWNKKNHQWQSHSLLFHILLCSFLFYSCIWCIGMLCAIARLVKLLQLLMAWLCWASF